MAKPVALTGGAYQSRSVIASAQRSLNLYGEPMPAAQGEPGRMADYPTPGTTRLTEVNEGPIRGIYQASNGAIYVVANAAVASLDPVTWAATYLGSITAGLTTPVSMADNGLELVIVDGSANGWRVRLSDNFFAQINPAQFRYWRVNVSASGYTTSGGYVGFAEVHFLVGGISQMGSGTADDSDPAHRLSSPSLAADGDTATWWAVHTPDALWSYDFGEGNDKQIDGVTIIARGDASPEMAPTAFTVEASVDNAQWFQAASFSGLSWTLGQSQTFGVGTPSSVGAFYGADAVRYLDTFFLFNKKGTPQFYWSLSVSTAFDPLIQDFANKESASDLLVTIAVTRREIYLLGNQTTEVWYDAGATDIGAGSSQFAAVQGVFIDHGVAAKYSVATYDNGVYWLSRNRQGRGVVLTSAGYRTERISTYAIEEALRTYTRIDDAIGWCYQISGHTFYVLTFPAADRTWCYDVGTKEWHEWGWIDTNGDEHRHRANCFATVNNQLVVGDWQDGSLYRLDNDVYTDAQGTNTGPIKRVRSFPHIEADGRRLFFREFVANMATGNAQTPVAGSSTDVSLRWSDDRGASWGSPVTQSIGLNGEYLTTPQWQRLGLSRSRVFEISWSTPMNTALQGCWITVEPADADEPTQQAAEAAE